jgi:hypothetical protein
MAIYQEHKIISYPKQKLVIVLSSIEPLSKYAFLTYVQQNLGYELQEVKDISPELSHYLPSYPLKIIIINELIQGGWFSIYTPEYPIGCLCQNVKQFIQERRTICIDSIMLDTTNINSNGMY